MILPGPGLQLPLVAYKRHLRFLSTKYQRDLSRALRLYMRSRLFDITMGRSVWDLPTILQPRYTIPHMFLAIHLRVPRRGAHNRNIVTRHTSPMLFLPYVMVVVLWTLVRVPIPMSHADRLSNLLPFLHRADPKHLPSGICK